MRKICVVVGSRANYSSIKSVMSAIQEHPELTLQTVVGASAVLDRYGEVSNLIEKDGFFIDEKFFMLLEGETPVTMAKSTGLGLVELTSIFDRLRPDFVVTVGDRFETMSATLAAAYMNIRLVHTMGGEVTGTIDESIRHATTKFAHVHFPSSEDAKQRIIKLGEDPDTVFNYGCPRMDLVKKEIENTHEPIFDELAQMGVGDQINFSKPFLLVSQHPVTTEYGDGESQIRATLEAVIQSGMQAIVLWPNADAGSYEISRGIRKFRESGESVKLRFFKNLPIATYVHLMNQTACLVGNSSSGIREGAFLGTPVVNIGTRQNKRERANNVLDADHHSDSILAAIKKQVEHGKFSQSTLYGDGSTGAKIAELLSKIEVPVQKVIYY
ncbi:MAG: UDP-N-acetylglucosamine 2-epimerase (hydrolyzing) [Bdellovibrionaceae bacterium]|nr:UDP-N-acetylglucosamine 2-epimerase (hydrolyzing) [Pseudobdellovibrionaceae bacterium]|tara:strand:+ start:1351 stop:2502 length:1152 start_codon:yes stop_codon:yes gene_type:complete